MSNHIGTMSLGNTPKHTQETPSTQLDSFSNSTSQIESLEKDTYERKTTQETIRLKSSVETMQYGDNQLVTLEALKDTPLKETMLSVLAHQDFDQVPVLQNKSPEQRVEFLFRKINIGLTRFYARKLNLNPDQGVPPYLEKVVLPATECFLMDLLRKTGQETNINFLGSLSQMSFDKIGQLFEDIKAFSEKFTLPFSQAKALLNLSDFLALPKNRARLENLTSPYEFYEKVMKHPLWTKEFVSEPVKANEQEKKVNIYELRWEDFGLDSTSAQLSDEEKQQHLETEKEKIKEELWTTPMIHSPETVKKLLNVLQTSDSYFEKTDLMREQVLTQAESIWKINSTIKDFLGLDLLKEIRNSPLAAFANFFLGMIGFSWGIEGITRGVFQRKLDREMKKPQKDAITELYTKYQEEKKLNDTTAKELLDSYQLKISEHEVSKFAVDLPLIKNQLLEKIDEKPELLNLNTLRSLESKQGFKGKDLVEEVKTKEGKVSLQLKATLTEEECEQVIDLYLQTMLQHFTDPKKTDLLKTFESADDLTFALIAGIFVDKENVMDGIEAGVLFPSQFYDVPEARINKNETSNSATSSQSEEIKNTTKNYGNTPAVRNNNPGNIMDTAFGGEKVPWERFTVFSSPKEGFDALVNKIINIQSWGSKIYSPEMSLLSYIQKYAPEADANNPIQYANNIAKDLSINPETPLKDINPFQLACAHSKYEDHQMFQKLKDLDIIPSSFA